MKNVSKTIIEFVVDHTKPQDENIREVLRDLFGTGVNVYTLTGEDYQTLDNMEKYGGSFVVSLANAMRHADLQNAFIIKLVWAHYFKQYAPKNVESHERGEK